MKKKAVQLASHLFPGLIANFAYNQLTHPQVLKLRTHELTVLDQADQQIFKYKNFDIKCYHWKGGEKRILLVHGWEGQAGNFSDLIQKLQVAGYSIYAFDAPSHGFSSKGKTSFFDFSELVGIMIKKYNIMELISHSFGGVACTYALYSNPELKIDKYVLITTPDKFSQRIDSVSNQVGITDKVKRKLIDRLEKETEKKVTEMNVSDFVKHIGINKVLILHDEKDKVIPITQSENVAANWDSCKLVRIQDTGHFRILRTESVLDLIINFLA